MNYADIYRKLMNAQSEDEKYCALIEAIEFLENQISELKKKQGV